MQHDSQLKLEWGDQATEVAKLWWDLHFLIPPASQVGEEAGDILLPSPCHLLC